MLFCMFVTCTSSWVACLAGGSRCEREMFCGKAAKSLAGIILAFGTEVRAGTPLPWATQASSWELMARLQEDQRLQKRFHLFLTCPERVQKEEKFPDSSTYIEGIKRFFKAIQLQEKQKRNVLLLAITIVSQTLMSL